MLKDKSMLVRLNICIFSASKTDKKLSKEVNENHGSRSDAAKVVKRILPDEALEGLKKISGEARTYHAAQTLPWTDEGTRILPTANFMRYTEKMRQYSVMFYDLVEKFKGSYESFVAVSRTRLNGMFNEADYPSLSALENRFRFKTDFQPIPDSGDFRISLQNQEMDSLREDLNERVKDAEKLAQAELYKRLAEPLGAMVERLSDPKNNFRDSLVSNLVEIVDLIPTLNITGDPVLLQLAQDARGLTKTSPNRLRDDKITRNETARKAQEILDKMAAYSA